MVVTVRSDLRRYRGGSRLRRGTMRQDDDERRDHQRKGGRQRDEAVRRMPRPAMAWRLAQTLPSLKVAISPLGGY